MHSAPAVSFPVGRSRFQACLIGSLIACSVLTVSTWCWQTDVLGWRQVLAATFCLMTAGLAGWHWWRTPNGSLAWDGASWYWAEGAQSLLVVPDIVMDLQQVVLLVVRTPADARVNWLWLDRKLNPARWVALRRAIYTRTRGTADLLGYVARPPADTVKPV